LQVIFKFSKSGLSLAIFLIFNFFWGTSRTKNIYNSDSAKKQSFALLQIDYLVWLHPQEGIVES